MNERQQKKKKSTMAELAIGGGSMSDLLRAAERALSEAWDETIRLTFREPLENRRHVARLDVSASRSDLPKTVILKCWRGEGDEGIDRYDVDSALLREWTGLEFVAEICGAGSLAPQMYGGDKDKGFILIADLREGDTLQQVLQGNNALRAEQALRSYGETLGKLHAQTLGRSEAFAAQWRKLAPHNQGKPFDYPAFFRATLKTLAALVEVRSTASSEVPQAADALSQPEFFSALHHGDPIPSNSWIDHSGRCYLLDFESAHFDHALLEGVGLRMGFPTEGMAFSNRIPEAAWRPAETAYRAALVTRCPEAADTQVYGSVMTAACAFWTFVFCGNWLQHAIADELPPPKLNRLRQIAITRIEAFVQAAQEFDSLPALGETFAELLVDLCSRWTLEARALPLYPAFQGSDVLSSLSDL